MLLKVPIPPSVPNVFVTCNGLVGPVVPMPTFPPNVAKPEALNVVVVALVADRLLIQAVSLTVR